MNLIQSYINHVGIKSNKEFVMKKAIKKTAAFVATVAIYFVLITIINTVVNVAINLAFDKTARYKAKAFVATINEKCRNLLEAFRTNR